MQCMYCLEVLELFARIDVQGPDKVAVTSQTRIQYTDTISRHAWEFIYDGSG